MTSSVIDELRSAKALIDAPEKWAWRMFTHDGRRCAYRAIVDAGISDEATAHVYAAIGSPPGCGLIAWNDALERTHGEVMDMFDRAMALAQR